MKLTPQEWRILQIPLTVFGGVVICMVLLVGFAHHRESSSASALQAQEQLMNQARQRYQSSGQEKETIVQYLPVYQRLIREGFIGEEKRIEWVDNLRTIHQENKLFGINYSIGVQEAYKPGFNLNPGTLALYHSVMKLELAMLHEGDLLLLMDELRARKITPFILRQCEVVKRAGATFDKFAPNLQANCELDWLTVREPQVLGALQP
ncbi:MAG: hypothetical protein CVU35_02095 [Betaproteobacteria bacterium HGW-Betaproteobacteria-8]|nr:MAG: hypothetical protein CVU35_02095 [Betaproteobacteria bacterium HGW-Betaproteobacteria-8]